VDLDRERGVGVRVGEGEGFAGLSFYELWGC